MLCAGGVLGKDSCQVSTLQSYRNCRVVLYMNNPDRLISISTVVHFQLKDSFYPRSKFEFEQDLPSLYWPAR